MKTTALLIDDEPKALAILQNKIERYCDDVEIVATTQDPNEGLELILEMQPDIVFLDIAMPQISGFDLLAKIENPDFEIIFVTAFDEFAIDAIKHCAIGYLVKPVDNTDLKNTIARAVKNRSEKTALQKNKLLLENLKVTTFQNKKIVVPSVEGLEFVKIADIIHCEGVDGYTKIHLPNKKSMLSSNSIGHFNKLLSNNDFYLVHKSHLINVSYIEKYLNEGYVCLSENHIVPVSRNRRQEFLNSLKNE